MSAGERRSVRCFVGGRVQGVWFRQSTLEQARERALAGWVRNLDDGRVEARLQGPAEAVEAVLVWMRSGGPPAAEVSGLEVAEEAFDDSLGEDFELRR